MRKLVLVSHPNFAFASLLTILMISLGCLRVIDTYRFFWQTWDEAAHIAAGMQWLEKGKYTYEIAHPPLARMMCALGLLHTGEIATLSYIVYYSGFKASYCTVSTYR